MSIPQVIKSRGGEWWFSDVHGSSDLMLEFDVPDNKWRDSFKLRDDTNISKHTSSIEWNVVEDLHLLQIHVITDFDNDKTIPYDTINGIITYLDKYNAKLRTLLVSFFDSDIDISPMIKTPRNIEFMSSSTNITIPSNNKIKKMSISGCTADSKIAIININIENCRYLEELFISGDYKFHHSIYEPNKFKGLTRLQSLYMVEESKYRKDHQLPHLEYCKRLKTTRLSSKYVPKSIRDDHKFGIVSLCKKLRKSLNSRLIDICLALCQFRINSKPLPTYVILWIVDWLPQSDCPKYMKCMMGILNFPGGK